MKVSMFMMADALMESCGRGSLSEDSRRICLESVLPYTGAPLTESAIYVVDTASLGVGSASGGIRLLGNRGYAILVGGNPETPLPSSLQYLVANEGIGFAMTLERALLAFLRFERWNARLTEELLGNCDLNALCEIGSDLMQRAILVFDKNYAIIGNSIPYEESIDSNHFEKRSSYYVTQPQALQDLVEKREFQDTFRTKGASFYRHPDVRVDEEDPTGSSSLYVNLGKGATYQGRIVIPWQKGEPREGDYQIAELFCEAVRRAMRRPTLQSDELDRVFKTYFITMLEGRAESDRRFYDSLRLWNWQRHGRFACFWAELTPRAVETEAGAFLCFQIEKSLAGSCAVRYKEGVACVAPLDEGIDCDGVLDAFRSSLAGMSASIGVSEEFEDLLETGEYFTESRIAASMCVEQNADVCRFGDVALAHYHRFGCSHLPAYHFCDRDVKKLIQYRGQHRDYYAILKTYLEHNMNLLRASEALFVHRTTLFNYLKEIREIIDGDLNDTETRLRMLASFEILTRDEA